MVYSREKTAVNILKLLDITWTWHNENLFLIQFLMSHMVKSIVIFNSSYQFYFFASFLTQKEKRKKHWYDFGLLNITNQNLVLHMYSIRYSISSMFSFIKIRVVLLLTKLNLENDFRNLRCIQWKEWPSLTMMATGYWQNTMIKMCFQHQKSKKLSRKIYLVKHTEQMQRSSCWMVWLVSTEVALIYFSMLWAAHMKTKFV